MSLTFFSFSAALAGLGALAGGLYWLQRLRVRHREVPVVTALFWREAVEETRARELRLRFRHPLAYLSILAICAALWLAAAGLRIDRAPERQLVCLLDASAGMARGTRFADAVDRLRETLDGLPVSQRSAIFCGSSPISLLLPGEELAWFDRRLAGLGPDQAPSSIDARLHALAALSTEEHPVTALVFGDAHLDEASIDFLPESFEFATFTELRSGTAECGITAFGVTPAASGDWAAVDLLVELSGAASRELDIELDDTPLQREAERTDADGRRRLLYRDLPANGATLTARLRGTDALKADDEAQFVLPVRRRVRIALDPQLPVDFRRALAADPGVELVDDSPDVHFGDQPGADVPTLALTTDTSGVIVRAPADDLQRAAFSRRLQSAVIGDAARVPVFEETSVKREIYVGTAALGESRGWTESRSFPLFVAEAARWLAGQSDGPRWVAAGRALEEAEPITQARSDRNGQRLDPVGAHFMPPRVGTYASTNSATIAAALLDRATTEDIASTVRADTPTLIESDPPAVAHWLALLAFVALLVEWVLVRRGRMP